MSLSSSSPVITVVSVDDHALVRQGIRSLLDAADGIRLVGEGSAGEEIEGLVEQLRPDILLLDLGLPTHADLDQRQPGERYPILDAIRRLAERYPATRILVLSQYDDSGLVRATLDAGVQGYLLKDDALSSHLEGVIRAVHAGDAFFSASVNARLVAEQNAGEEPLLTPRQVEILTALAVDPHLPRSGIAARLGISEHTLTYHLRLIFARLDVTNLTAAVMKAIQLELLPRPLVAPERGAAVTKE
ncbi:MAG: response regulator transcription factor [Chloroflexi bacterium]|nr:response regulator transcription factor [Chloroflexota bacterium]